MANYDSAAIIRAYAGTVKIIDGDRGVFDKSGNEITLDQSRIDAARIELDAEAAAIKYKTDRTENGSKIYDTFSNQLDMLYHDLVAGKLDATGSWAVHVKEVKDANPKPS